jgi:hypothetical protein
VVFTGLKATIATYKLGAVRLSSCEMRLKVLSSAEDLVGRADAAMVRPRAMCMFVFDVINKLVRVVEEQRTMTTFMRLRKCGAGWTMKCCRAQRRLCRQAGHRRRARGRIGDVIDPNRTRQLQVVRRG